MNIICAYEYVFPVVGANVERTASEDAVIIKQVYGTAFSIDSHCLLTAAHVLHAASENPFFGLAFPDGRNWKTSPITDFETIDDYDLGIVKTKLSTTQLLKWNLSELPMLHQVQVAGYPYALDLEHSIIHIRAFTGYVVSNLTFYTLKANPRAYELSFTCPRGLSGAPLIDSKWRIAGLVIGNKATQMLVFSNKEVLSEGKHETVVEKYESLRLGIVVQSGSLVDLHSRILGGSLYNHLTRSSLIKKERPNQLL